MAVRLSIRQKVPVYIVHGYLIMRTRYNRAITAGLIMLTVNDGQERYACTVNNTGSYLLYTLQYRHSWHSPASIHPTGGVVDARRVQSPPGVSYCVAHCTAADKHKWAKSARRAHPRSMSQWISCARRAHPPSKAASGQDVPGVHTHQAKQPVGKMCQACTPTKQSSQWARCARRAHPPSKAASGQDVPGVHTHQAKQPVGKMCQACTPTKQSSQWARCARRAHPPSKAASGQDVPGVHTHHASKAACGQDVPGGHTHMRSHKVSTSTVKGLIHA